MGFLRKSTNYLSVKGQCKIFSRCVMLDQGVILATFKGTTTKALI